MFEHSEYHIYTTNDQLERDYVHLDAELLQEAADLHEQSQSSDDWATTHRFPVGDNIYLTVGDGAYRVPRLESHGYEGWVGIDDGRFEEPVFFDGMIFHKCIGRGRTPEWSFTEVKEWVNYEHQGQFEREFDEYLSSMRDDYDAVVDW